MIRFFLVKHVPLAGWLFSTWLFSNLYELLVFVAVHRRWPRFHRTGYLNDLLFGIRASEDDIILRSFTSDKEFTKQFVRGVTGEQLGTPTLDVIRSAEALDGYRFPPESVVKPTHMSGKLVFVGPDGAVSVSDRARIKGWMSENFGIMTGERHYLRLEPKVIVEPWLKLNGGYCNDYKFTVFKGVVRVVELTVGRFEGGEKCAVFDRDWEPLDVRSRDFPALDLNRSTGGDLPELLRKPALFEKMVAVAEAIGRLLFFVRVDVYTDGVERLYVGEISHVPANVRERFETIESERAYLTGVLEP